MTPPVVYFYDLRLWIIRQTYWKPSVLGEQLALPTNLSEHYECKAFIS